MRNFHKWLSERDPKLFKEFQTVGHAEDWADDKAANSRFNTPQYMARGIRSKYIASMKAETSKKKKRRLKRK